MTLLNGTFFRIFKVYFFRRMEYYNKEKLVYPFFLNFQWSKSINILYQNNNINNVWGP